MRLRFFYLFFAGLVACQPADKAAEGSSDQGASSQTLLQELKTIASGACTKTSDCYSAGIGSRACGGPEDYMVFSKWDSASKILDTVYNYNKAREKENSGTVGTCEYRMPPAVTCSQNKCKKLNTSATQSTSLSVVSGVITLSASQVTGAASMTFKVQNNSTIFYLRVSQLDFTARTQLESYRKTNASVNINVRILALMTEAPACEFRSVSCLQKVSVYDVRALRILSVQ
jgi:hypothetical protein